jgi:hypothetical protein
MKPLIILFILTACALAQTPQIQAPRRPLGVPAERIERACQLLQTAEHFAKTGVLVSPPAASDDLRAETLRLLSWFNTNTVQKARRDEVLALYVQAVERITLGRENSREALVDWSVRNPAKWSEEIRRREKQARPSLLN